MDRETKEAHSGSFRTASVIKMNKVQLQRVTRGLQRSLAEVLNDETPLLS